MPGSDNPVCCISSVDDGLTVININCLTTLQSDSHLDDALLLITIIIYWTLIYTCLQSKIKIIDKIGFSCFAGMWHLSIDLQKPSQQLLKCVAFKAAALELCWKDWSWEVILTRDRCCQICLNILQSSVHCFPAINCDPPIKVKLQSSPCLKHQKIQKILRSPDKQLSRSWS